MAGLDQNENSLNGGMVGHRSLGVSGGRITAAQEAWRTWKLFDRLIVGVRAGKNKVLLLEVSWQIGLQLDTNPRQAQRMGHFVLLRIVRLFTIISGARYNNWTITYTHGW